MHSVSKSAISTDEGARTRRMQRTRAALVEHARTLTARRGLAGFTVEELCEHVGVSRRTFFNYFASKEDAVLGNPPAALTPEDRDEFVAGGDRTEPGSSPALLRDIARLAVALFERNDFTREQHRLRCDIVRSEPQLLARMMSLGESHQQDFAELVAAREGLFADDPFVRVTVRFVAGLVHDAVDEFFRTPDSPPFRDLLERDIGCAQRLLEHSLDLHDPTGIR